MNEKPLSAVITGDFIASRTAGTARVDKAMRTLECSAKEFGGRRNTNLKFTRFRGDGWQVFLRWPQFVLEATLYLSARLRAADHGLKSRISAGIGTVESTGTNDLSDASGEAFFTSGGQLERMSTRKRFAIAGQGISIWQEAIFDLADLQSSRWSAAQAEVVAMMLEDGSAIHEEVADRIGITRQAVQARLAGAGFSAFEKANEAFLEHKFLPPTREQSP